MHNRQTAHHAEHRFVYKAVISWHGKTVFDSGIRKEGHGLRQLSVIAWLFAPVEAAARHGVEGALSTTERAGARG